MNQAIVTKLESGFVKLIAALDGNEADAIIEAAAALKPLISELEQSGVWRRDEAIKTRLLGLSKLINASRYRVNKLTELNESRQGSVALAIKYQAGMAGLGHSPG